VRRVVGDEVEPLIVAVDPAFVLERTPCKRRSGRRLFQQSWSIDFQAFPASASTSASASVNAPSTYEDATRHAAPHFAGISSGRGDVPRNRTTITTRQRRGVYYHCPGCFRCGYGKSKSWFALWNSGSRQERHGHESLYTGGRKVCRCHRFCVRVRRKRSIHRKVFFGSVNLGIIRNGLSEFAAPNAALISPKSQRHSAPPPFWSRPEDSRRRQYYFCEEAIPVLETSSAFQPRPRLASHYKIKLTANSCIALCSSINAVDFSSLRTMKRFPSRCASCWRC
jgi:hypothetical protein